MSPRLRHDGDDRVLACPECDLAGEVWKRTHKTRSYEFECKCHKCGAEFDEDDVVDREPKQSRHGGGRLAKGARKLLEADPDDVTIVTDGGTARDEKDSRHPGQGITQDRDVEDARPYYDGGAHAE